MWRVVVEELAEDWEELPLETVAKADFLIRHWARYVERRPYGRLQKYTKHQYGALQA